MIKALFLDLDGTLLTSENKISLTSLKALQACRYKGISIFPTTGRPPLLDEMIHLNLEEKAVISDGGIYYNGGCICRNELKEYTRLSLDTVEAVVEYVSGFEDINIVIQMTDEIHSFRYDLTEDNIPKWGITNGHILPFSLFNKLNVVKIYLYTKHWNIDLSGVYEHLKTLTKNEASIYLTAGGKTIDIVGKNVSKKTGIEKMIKQIGLNPEEIAVFGDDTNDFEMLSSFPNSIAMGNAVNEIKAIASYVTLDNDQDGIYHALKNHFCII